MSIYLREGTFLAGRYTIVKVISRGGSGITYLALDQHISKQVAIKELYTEPYVFRDADRGNELQFADEHSCACFANIRTSFLEEARVLSRYHEESAVVTVLDFFAENETAYLVMEYISGGTLADAIQKGIYLPAKELFGRMLPVMQALKVLHSDHVLHLDISPSNLVQQSDGSLKLIDFGSVSPDGMADMSSSVVTDGYAPVEQWQGRNIGPWTDIYALCAVIYACLTGVNPESSVQRALQDELKMPSQLGIDIGKDYEEILRKGLALQPEGRYRTMQELIGDIEKALNKKPPVPLWKKLSAGAVAALCCMGLLWGGHAYQNYKEKHKFDGIETITAVLTPDKEVTARDYGSYLEEVTASVSALSGTLPWDISTDDEGQVRIRFAKEVLPDAESMKGFADHLVPMQKALLSGYTFTYDYKYRFSDKDIDSVEICTGFPETHRKEWMEEFDMTEEDTEHYSYLKITLAEEALSGIEELPSFQRFLMNESYRILPGDKENEIYVFGMDQGEGALDMYARQIMQPQHDGDFEVHFEPEEPFEAQSESQYWGKWQTDVGNIQGDTVDLTYICTTDVSFQERNEDLIHLKERLDALKVPYAFRVLQDGAFVTVRIARTPMCRFIPELLGLNIWSRDLAISDGISDTGAAQLKADAAENGDVRFSAAFEDDDRDSFLDMMEMTGREICYLMVGGNVLGSCRDLSGGEDGRMSFDLEIPQLQKDAPGAEQIADYINALMAYRMNMEYEFFSSVPHLFENTEDDGFYAYTPQCVQEFMKKVRAEYPEMTMHYECDNSFISHRGELAMELQEESPEGIQEEELAKALQKADLLLSDKRVDCLPADLAFSYKCGEGDAAVHVKISFFQSEAMDENYNPTGSVDRGYSVVTVGKHVFTVGDMVKKVIDGRQLFANMTLGLF